MYNNIITRVKEGSIYNGLEISNFEDKNIFFLITVKKKKQVLELVKSTRYSDLKMLSSEINRSLPLFIVIDTRHVLTKVVSSSIGDSLNIINSAFPSINTSSFYYEHTSSGPNQVVAVCRKEQVHATLNKLGAHNLYVTGFSLGILPIALVTRFIPTHSIVVPHTKIRLKNNHIETIEKNSQKQTETYTINGITLKSHFLPGFSKVLSFVIKSTASCSNFEDVNTYLYHRFYHRRFFNIFIKFGIATLLLLLLANFLFFNYYYEKAAVFQETLLVKNGDRDHVLELNQSLKDKQKLVHALLASSSSKSAFYIDRIALAIPHSIILDEFVYQPINGQIKQENEIIVTQETIMVSGLSNDSKAFSSWVEAMEKWDWITRIKIQDYDYHNTSTSSFVLWIYLK